MAAEPTQEVQHSSFLRRSALWLRRLVAAGLRRIVPRKDYVVHKGSVLPNPDIRICDSSYDDNDYFLETATHEARRVTGKLGCPPQGLIIDIGSGQGRLPIGLIREGATCSYLGLDVSKLYVDWCRRQITARHPSYQFRHIDLVNARYNPTGGCLGDGFRLPVEDGAADVVYMWGVVTNMEPEHLDAYVSEICRVLHAGGRAFLTAHIEDGVPPVSINPADYTDYSCQGPLHAVRYEKHYFLEKFQRRGLTLTDLDHHAVGNCQSEISFKKE